MKITAKQIKSISNTTASGYIIFSKNGDRYPALFFSDKRKHIDKETKKEYLRKAKEDVMGLVSPAWRERTIADVEKCIQNKKPLSFCIRLVDASFGSFWASCRIKYLGENEKGWPMICAFLAPDDVFAGLIVRLLDSTDSVVYVADKENCSLLIANKTALSLNHITLEPNSDLKCYKAIFNRDQPCPWCQRLKATKNREKELNFTEPLTQRCYSGKCQYVNWAGTDAVACFLHDKTEDIQLRNRLIKEKQNADRTLNSIPCGISVYEKKDGIIRRINLNGYTEQIKGVAREALLKENFLDIFSRVWPADKDRVIKDTENVFIKGHTICVYRTMNQKTKKYIWMHREGLSFSQEDGSQLAYFVYTDITFQMQAESELAQSKKRYQLAVKGAGILVWEYDIPTHTARLVDKTMAPHLKANVFTNIPDSLMPYVEERSAKDFRNLIRRIGEGKSSIEEADIWTNHIPNINGAHCHHLTFSIEFNRSGKPEKAYAVDTDITPSKIEEESFSDSIQGLLTANPDSLCTFRINLTTNTCVSCHGSSAYIIKMLNSKTGDEWFEKFKKVIISDKKQPDIKKTLNRNSFMEMFHQGKRRFSITYRRSMEDGKIKWVETFFSLLSNPLTGEVETVIYSLDVDNLKKKEKVIERITNSHFDFVGLINAEDQTLEFTSINEDAVDVFVVHSNDYTTIMNNSLSITTEKKVSDNINEEAKLSVVKERISHGDGTYSFNYQMTDKNGAMHVKRVSFSYLDSSREFILITRSDVTKAVEEEQQTEEKLQKALSSAQKANQSKTDFLSNISHDMRTPLNGVIGYTDLALKSDNLQTIKDYLTKIKDSGQTLLSLINDTLDLSKIENGAVKLNMTPANGHELISSVITSIQPSLDKKNIRFVADREQLNLEVETDVMKFTEIFNNILSNAVKFTPIGGEIDFTSKFLSHTKDLLVVEFTVKDNGVGMSEAFLAKAFEPFTQERSKANAYIGGSGLGLSIVRKFIEMLHGTIKISSELGKGTTVVFSLPFKIVAAAENKNESEEIPEENLQGKKILLVEDNPMNREIAETILTQKGIKVVSASDGSEGVEAFKSSPVDYYDVILMDIRMPLMNGFEASRAIRSLPRADAKDIVIIAMTADAYEDDVKRCLDAGMNGHISKPVNPQQLFKQILVLTKNKKK